MSTEELSPNVAETILNNYISNQVHSFKTVEPGRNEPCDCGSGKKYKNCHWRSEHQLPTGHQTPESIKAFKKISRYIRKRLYSAVGKAVINEVQD